MIKYLIIIFLFFISLFLLITNTDIENFISDVTNEEIILDEQDAEQKVFDKINSRRFENNIEELKYSELLENVARRHSEDMNEREFFAHTNPDGDDVYNRLMEDRIFYFIASENLFRTEIKNNQTTQEIADKVVDGWIKSPSHRIPVLDIDDPINWDHVGIGVVCENRVCYITAVFAGFVDGEQSELEEGYVKLFDLYSRSLGFEIDTELRIYFESDNKADVYVIPDEDQYDNFIERKSFDKIIERKNVDFIDEIIVAKPGYSILIHADRNDIEYNLTVYHNP